MEKEYIIVGGNNFWYSTFKASRMDEIAAEVQQVAENLDKYPAGSEPDVLHVYQVNLLQSINV